MIDNGIPLGSVLCPLQYSNVQWHSSNKARIFTLLYLTAIFAFKFQERMKKTETKTGWATIWNWNAIHATNTEAFHHQQRHSHSVSHFFISLKNSIILTFLVSNPQTFRPLNADRPLRKCCCLKLNCCCAESGLAWRCASRGKNADWRLAQCVQHLVVPTNSGCCRAPRYRYSSGTRHAVVCKLASSNNRAARRGDPKAEKSW